MRRAFMIRDDDYMWLFHDSLSRRTGSKIIAHKAIFDNLGKTKDHGVSNQNLANDHHSPAELRSSLRNIHNRGQTAHAEGFAATLASRARNA